MADEKQQPSIRDMINAIGSLAEMAHVFYTGMKVTGASEAEASARMQSFIAAMWHEAQQDAREAKRRRDEQAEAE